MEGPSRRSTAAAAAWRRKMRAAAHGVTTKATAREISMAAEAPLGMGLM